MSASMFRGGPVLALDGKGRITVPARWREVLVATVQGRLVVCKGHPEGLKLYPLPVWERFEAILMGLPAEDDCWRRYFIGSATEVEIDSASRVLIPPELRSWAGLEHEVKFMGVGSHFELWAMAQHADDDTALKKKPLPAALASQVL